LSHLFCAYVILAEHAWEERQAISGAAMRPITQHQHIDRGAICVRCGDTITVPTWSGAVSLEEARNFWRCSSCGYMFETLDPILIESTLPVEVVDEFLPSLLVA